MLDTRLPAALNRVSADAGGSLANPLKPDQDVIGSIETATGPLDVMVERVDRGANGRVWLFARGTLDEIPRRL